LLVPRESHDEAREEQPPQPGHQDESAQPT